MLSFIPLFPLEIGTVSGRLLKLMQTLHQQVTNQFPIGMVDVPREDPNWDYKVDSQDWRQRGLMITCLVVGMDKSFLKAVNYAKIKEITWAT
jgi:hypothetical protein